jgi:hypothetical protein
MNIHTVNLPDGTTAKRTSENRTYTHVLVGHYRKGTRSGHWEGERWVATFAPDPEGGTLWSAISWHGSQALAVKEQSRWQRIAGPAERIEIMVLPCTVETKTPKATDPRTARKALLARRAGYMGGGWFEQQVAWITRLTQDGAEHWANQQTETLAETARRAAHYGLERLAMNEDGGA